MTKNFSQIGPAVLEEIGHEQTNIVLLYKRDRYMAVVHMIMVCYLQHPKKNHPKIFPKTIFPKLIRRKLMIIYQGQYCQSYKDKIFVKQMILYCWEVFCHFHYLGSRLILVGDVDSIGVLVSDLAWSLLTMSR